MKILGIDLSYTVGFAILLFLLLGVLGCLISSVCGDPTIIRRENRGKKYILFWLIVKMISFLMIDTFFILVLLSNIINNKPLSSMNFIIIFIIILEILSLIDYIFHIRGILKEESHD